MAAVWPRPPHSKFAILGLLAIGAAGLPSVLPAAADGVMATVHPKLRLEDILTATPRGMLLAGLAFALMAVPAILSAYAGQAEREEA